MSISLLKDNTLWTDSVGQDQTSYPYLYTEMKKLFISDRGDNRMAVLTALHLGKAPKKAIELAVEMYYGSNPNYPILSIKQSKLKPIDLDYYVINEEGN